MYPNFKKKKVQQNHSKYICSAAKHLLSLHLFTVVWRKTKLSLATHVASPLQSLLYLLVKFSTAQLMLKILKGRCCDTVG